ncbi:hypothetical protein ABK040_001133 [Willaertia magna]
MPQLFTANFPVTEDGRTYHVDLKKGQLANRIITVGDLKRAERYAENFDSGSVSVRHLSDRGFFTITGTFKGVPVSIIGIGMGFSMMDFMVRECLYCFEEGQEVAIIRLGTCGTPDKEVKAGDFCVCEDSIFVTRNPDYFTKKYENQLTPEDKPYKFSLKVKSNNDLKDCLSETFKSNNLPYHVGTNATADSFYSSQGRNDPRFDDENDEVEKELQLLHVKSLEMESFQLLDLARCVKTNIKVKACAATLVLAQRVENVFIDVNLKHEREILMGKIGLEAIIKCPLNN